MLQTALLFFMGKGPARGGPIPLSLSGKPEQGGKHPCSGLPGHFRR